MTRKARKAQPKGRAATGGGRTKRSGQRRSTKAPTHAAKLTHQQRQFVQEYITDWNATQAAIRAGYSEKNASSIGYQLLQKTPVQEYLELAKKEVLDRAGIRTEAILLELAKIGFASKRRIMVIGEDGEPSVRPGSEIPDDDLDAVQDLSFQVIEIHTPVKDGVKIERRRSGRIKMHDKRAALVELGRYIGIFGPERLEVTGKNGGPLQTENVNAIPEDQRAERLAALLATAAARKTHAEE